MEKYNKETKKAIKEALEITKNSELRKSYENVDELIEDLNIEDK